MPVPNLGPEWKEITEEEAFKLQEMKPQPLSDGWREISEEEALTRMQGGMKPDLTLGRLGSQAYRSAAQGVGDIATGLKVFEQQKDMDWATKQPADGRPLSILEQQEQALRVRDIQENLPGRLQAYDKVKVAMPEMLPSSSGIIEDAVSGMSRFAPSMAAMAVSGPAGLATTFGQIVGNSYDQKVKAGVEPQRATESAIMEAIINTPLESAGNLVQIGAIKNLFKPLGKVGIGARLQRYLGNIVKGMAAEGMEEGLQAYGEEIANIYAANPKSTPEEMAGQFFDNVRTKEFLKQQAKATLTGAAGGGLLAGAGGMVAAPFDIASYAKEKGQAQPTEETATPTETKEQPASLVDGLQKGLQSGNVSVEQAISWKPELVKRGADPQAIDEIIKQYQKPEAPPVAEKVEPTASEAQGEAIQTEAMPEQAVEVKEPEKTELEQKQEPKAEVLPESIADRINEQRPELEVTYNGKQAGAGKAPASHQFYFTDPTTGKHPNIGVVDLSEENLTKAIDGKIEEFKEAQEKLSRYQKPESERQTGLPLTGERQEVKPHQAKKESNPLIDELVQEVLRVRSIRNNAIHRGKRSKAKVNIEKIAQKYNVPSELVDRAVGMGTLSGVDLDQNTIRNTIESVITSTTASEATEKGREAEAIAEPQKPEVGRAWVNNQFRPIVQAREIKKGKNKGKVQVILPGGKTRIVEAKDVREWPGKGEERPTETSQGKTANYPISKKIQEKSKTIEAEGIKRKGEVAYSTKNLLSEALSSADFLKTVRQEFKRQTVKDNGDGTVTVATRSGEKFTVKSVKQISENKASFEIAYGRPKSATERIAGAYYPSTDTIEIVKGVGDRWTVSHESFHRIKKLGKVTAGESKAIDAKIRAEKKDPTYKPTEEDQARWVEKALPEREKYRGTTIGKILQRLGDLIDSFVNLFHATSRSVLRGMESGKIYERGAKSGVNEFAQSVKFSVKQAAKNIMENPNFRKWFKGSKVVDAEERPLVVYHGTSSQKFRAFKSKENEFFFTDKRKIAEEFGYRIEETYLSLKNPYVIDLKGASGIDVFDAIDYAKAHGHDGVIAKNVSEGEGLPGHAQYVSFSPTQIKSIFNRGTFDEKNPNILYSTKPDPELKAFLETYGKPQEEMPPKSQAKGWLRREAGYQLKNLAQLRPKNRPALDFWEQVLKSPEWWDHENIQKIVEYAIGRHEIFSDNFNSLNEITDPKLSDKDSVIEELTALKNKGMTRYQRMTGKTSREYQDLLEMLDEGDSMSGPWNKDKGNSLEKRLKLFVDYQRSMGVSEETVRVWRIVRNTYDNALDMMLEPLRKILEQKQEEAAYGMKLKQAQGVDIENFLNVYDDYNQKVNPLSLKEVIAKMEEWRGFYAPRIRMQGKWSVRASRGSGAFEEFFFDMAPTRGAAERLADKLKNEGYKIQGIRETRKLPEEVYQHVSVMATAELLKKASEGVSLDDSAILAKFQEELIQQTADLIRVRGFRGSMVHRKAGEVVKGYLDDPLERTTRYLANTSAGLAKAETASKMVRELAKIDAASDSRAYAAAQRYIEEQLRNADSSDRVIGIAKSIATFKYLGLPNIRAPFVNVTAMLTTVPASIHQYVLKGKGNFAQVFNAVGKAGKDYAKYMATGNKSGLDSGEMAFLEEIKRKNYDDPQYTRDALGTLQSLHGKFYTKAMNGSMWLFGKTEQWNRGATLLAAYRLAKSKGMKDIDARKIAVEATGKAHGVYGRATLPAWAQGKNPFSKIAQMAYTYQKFGHNWLQMCYDLGLKKKNLRAFAWAMASPIVLGGVAAVPLKTAVMGLVGFILKAIGEDRDPEKFVWDTINRHLGTTTEKGLRYGIVGLGGKGVDITGSLSVDPGVPKDMVELTGAIGGVVKDLAEVMHQFMAGKPLRGLEALLPSGASSMVKAVRESQEGASTRWGNRVFDEKGRPYMPTAGETTLRAMGFRSARRAAVQAKQWEQKKEVRNFADRRSRIYEKLKAWQMQKPDMDKLKEILREIYEYNKNVVESGNMGIPIITKQAIRSLQRRQARPSKAMRAINY